uniref:SUMO interacting motifs containing 1 n=1 Tax=Salvator merianae TaxID=96440 RepID=A0A8D0BG73_SALMN
MAETVTLISDSSSDGEKPGKYSPFCRRLQLKRRKRRRNHPVACDLSEVIDLTGDDMVAKQRVFNESVIIDLTAAEDTMDDTLSNHDYFAWGLKHSTPVNMQPVPSPKILTSVDAECKLEVPVCTQCRDSERPWIKNEAGVEQTPCECSSFCLTSTHVRDSENSSRTSFNSDLGSLGSPQLASDVFSSPSSLSPHSISECQAFLNYVEEVPSTCAHEEKPSFQISPPHQRTSPNLIPNCSSADTSGSVAEDDQPLLETRTPVPSAVKSDSWESTKQIDIKVWFKTLQYFQGAPVHHPFLQSVVQEKSTKQKPQPIPLRKLSMVLSTIEENFFQGTLDFLMDYVSCQYYPPKEITSYIIRQILLSSEQEEIRKDAYMMLMKIQAFHPAKANTVAWDWQLLQEVMEDQENKFPARLLFLQYVVQTLEDDFQQMTRMDTLHKSIAKTVLSYDQCFGNVKELIEWLIAAVTETRSSAGKHLQKAKSPALGAPECTSSNATPQLCTDLTEQMDISPQFQSQKEVALLQRMLSISFEVDKSPYCSASKIVNKVFSSVLNIPKRCQREAFLSSMECHLLRCKVLELIFDHNCKIATKLPLSVEKILYFLNHFSLLLTYQDSEATWQRWDEMLHQLILLLLSYRNVVLEHLRTPVCERKKLIINAAKPKLQSSDCVEGSDVECSIKKFLEKLSQTLGQPIPSPIKEKTELLQILLLTAMDN